MDPGSRALQRARKEVFGSKEWEELNRELGSKVNQLEYLQGRGKLRAFASLPDQKKLVAVGKATRELEKTRAFSDLRAKVAASVDHHFISVNTQPVASSSADSLEGPSSLPVSDTSMEIVSKACSHLLLEWPHLTHHLKESFNNPLPPELRATAWKMILHSPAVRKDFLSKATSQEGFPEVTPDEKRIAHRCEVLLHSNPAFHEIGDSTAILRAMKSIILYWNHRSRSTVSDTELLLCLPFLYIGRAELSRMGANDNWTLIAEFAEQYVSFMEILPLTMHSIAEEEAVEAMNKFSERVEVILSEDRKFYQALQKIFGTPKRVASAVSQEEQLPFYKRLRNIIHPHVQRMLVGDVSMEVVCYIWDQCFIGMGLPEYQCFPYFVTVWLILLREKIMSCHSAKAVAEALANNSQNLTVRQFQQEIERRFLHKISSQLGILPIRMKERESFHSTSRAPIVSDHSQKQELEPATGEYHTALHDDPEKTWLRRKVVELQRELQQEQKILLDTLSQERKSHMREMDAVMKEIANLKEKISKSESQVAPSTAGVASIPSNIPVTLLSPLGSTGYVVSPPAQAVPILSVMPGPQLQDQQGTSSQPSHGRRPYSSSHLTESDIQDIWLQIFSRFTKAAYTVCHGTGKERQELYSAVKSETEQ